MNEFESLREQARAKRDATIAQARKEYKEAMRHIAAIQRSIVGDVPLATRLANEKTGVRTLRHAIAKVLGDRKMTATEITVHVLEMGYKTAMSKAELRKYITQILRKDGRFKRDGERWVMAHQ